MVMVSPPGAEIVVRERKAGRDTGGAQPEGQAGMTDSAGIVERRMKGRELQLAETPPTIMSLAPQQHRGIKRASG